MNSSTSASSASQQTNTASVQRASQYATKDKNDSSTDPFLRDFTLVAEAAKRAQMAVMIRDLESIGLS